MKDIEINKFDTNQRRLLQIGVILILVLFLGLFYLFSRKSTPIIQDNGVFLEDIKLQIFNDTYKFTGYPDKILFHYPYFILVQGNKPLTIIYNLETKQKVKEIQDVLLDYYDGNVVYNRKETFYNEKNLGEFCDSAFIKSSSEILCITKQSQNYADNRLISINPETPNLWKRLYQSDNILTTVSVINEDLYIGEINLETKQNYITVNEKTMPVESTVNIIYQMDDKPYFASFKSAMNKKNLHSQINGDMVDKQNEDRIYLFDK